MELEPSSFRDPIGRVFYHGGRVYRTAVKPNEMIMPPADLKGFWAAEKTRLEVCDGASAKEIDVVMQNRLELISYCYEWSYEMMRTSALFTLELQLELLDRGLSLKDAPNFNMTFAGCEPVHFDCYSIQKFTEGSLWAAYGQFCRAFLNPLLIWSHLGVDPRPFLRFGLGEISLAQTYSLMGFRSLLKAGYFKNVFLPYKLETAVSNHRRDFAVKVNSIKLNSTRLKNSIRGLYQLIERLKNPNKKSEWSNYNCNCTYSDDETNKKKSFVSNFLKRNSFSSIIDIGCNTGLYSKLAASYVKKVYACDSDTRSIDSMFLSCRNDDTLKQRIFPLLIDFSRPTPALGWRLSERKNSVLRLQADSFLALAVIHHLRITSAIPVEEILSFLASIAPNGVLEWVGPNDPMVQELNAFRKLDISDLDWPVFQKLVEQVFEIEGQVENISLNRKLIAVRRNMRYQKNVQSVFSSLLQ